MQSVEKEIVNLLGPHSQSELIRVCDTGGPGHPPRVSSTTKSTA